MLQIFPTSVKQIGTGDRAIAATLRLMRKMILDGSKNWEIRWTAVQIVKDLPARSDQAEVNAIFQWIQQSLRFTRDPIAVEMLHTPDVLLKLIRQDTQTAADCDDYVILGGSLLAVLGYPTRFKIISLNTQRKLQHVYLEVRVHGKWIPFDPIRRDKPLGWEVGGATRIVRVAIT